MSVFSLWRKVTLIDVFYLLYISASILTPIALSSTATRIVTLSDPLFIPISCTISSLQGLGIFNRVVYSLAILSNPERTDRVTKLMHFNLGSITGLSIITTGFNTALLIIVLNELNDGVTLVALVVNLTFLFFEKLYGRRFLKKHEKNVLREREALPLQHKKVIVYYTLSTNLMPLSWLLYLVTFVPLYWYI